MNKRVFRIFTSIVVAASMMATAWPMPALAAPAAVPSRSLPISAAAEPVPLAASAAPMPPAAPGDLHVYNSTNVPIAIATDGVIYTSRITVTDNYPIADVNVTLQITHTYDADLDIFLLSPSGTRVELTTDNGSSGDNYSVTTFDDEAVTPVISGTAPFNGSYRPEGLLSAVDDRNVNGVWTLEVYDDVGGDTGTLAAWSIAVQEGTPRPVYSNSAKKASAGIASTGQLLTYTINLSNTGLQNGVGTTLVDPIPLGTSFVSIVTPPEATYNAGQNRIEWTGTISQDTALDVSFVVSVTGVSLLCPGTITNTATISQSAIPAPVAVSTSTAYWSKLRYAEDFELSAGGYVTSGVNSSWAYGVPTTTVGINTGPGAAHSGSSLWATNLVGNYNVSENSYLESPVVDLHTYVPVPGYPLYLSWWQWLNTESCCDAFSVEVSGNGGGSWNAIYGPIRGSYMTWQRQTVDISAYATANFKVRFHLTSDSSVQYAGAYIDDISLQNCAPAPAIYIIPTAQTGQACPAGNTNYQFKVLNLADELGVTASFSQDSGVGALSFSPSTLPVAYGPGNEGVFTTTHTLPSYLFDGQTAPAVLRATAASYSSTARITTTVGNNWSTATSGGAPALWSAYTTNGTSLFYFDGKDSAGNPTNRVQIFTPNVGWTSGVTHTSAASFGGVAGYNSADGKVYYASGFGTGMVGDASFAVYNPVANTWASLPAKPQALGLGAGGVTSNGMFVWAGGSPNAGFVSTTPVYTYNIATNTWYTGTALNTVGFTAPGFVMVGNKLFVGGNYFGTNAFYVYDVTADTWTQLADLPTTAGKVSPLLISAAGGIYLIGGGTTPGTANATTWRYDIASNTWDTFISLPTAVIGSGGGLLGGELYAFGGGSNTANALSPAPHYKNLPACAYPNLVSLTGRVINGVTSSGIPSATVSALGLREISAPRPIPSTTTDASGYYTLTLNPAVYNVTAAKSPFDSKTEVVTVTLSGATQNFVLGPVAMQAVPNAFNVTAHYSETVQRTMMVTNSGYSNLNLQLVEYNGGFAPAPLGTFDYLSLPSSDAKTNGILPGMVFNGTGAPPPATRPAAYIYHGPKESIQAARILVYADDDIHTPTAVERGLQALGLTYTFYGYTSDGSGLASWLTALTTGGPWDLVIMDEENWTRTAADDYTAMNTFINGGGKAVAYSWAVGYDSGHSGSPLWATIGGAYVGNGTSAPLYWWVPGNPLFNNPETVPEFNPVDSSTYINVIRMDVLSNGTALAGFTTSPSAGQVGIILSNNKPAIFKGLGDYINGSDRDSDGKMDAAEWWTNAVNGLLNGFGGGGDIPWLTEVPTKTIVLPGASALVTLTFDAKTVNALGVYTGSLVLQGGTQPITVPVQMNVVDNLSVAPTNLDKTLIWGQTGNDQVTLSNLGTIPVNYQFNRLPILNEGFETWPPAGWQITNLGGSVCQWESTQTTGRPNTVGTGSAADADSDWCGSGTTMNTILQSPPIDLIGAKLATLTFGNYYRPLSSGDRGYLDITTDGGVNWTRLITYSTSTVGPGPVTTNLTPYVGKVAQLRFWYIATGWDWWWLIDDVKVMATESWLDIEPITGTLALATNIPVTFTYDSSGVPVPGVYKSNLSVTSPDVKGAHALTVTLRVVPAADSARLAGTILGNRTISGTNQPLKSAMVNVIGPAPVTLSTAADGSYGWWFTGAQTGTYTVTVSYPGYVPQTDALAISNGVTTTNNATLILDAPFLNANPEAIADVLPWGGSIMHTLTISNPAPAYKALNANLAEIAGSYTPPTIQTVQVNIPARASTQRAINAQAFTAQSTRAAQNRTIVVDKLALGKLKVLLVSSDWAYAGGVGGLDDILNAYPDLQVDVYPMEHNPTLTELMPYSVVIVGSNYTWESTFDHNAIGTALADYVDAGGKVIQLFGTMHGTPSGSYYWALGGRWQTGGYSPMTYSTYYTLFETRLLGVYLAGHPLMDNVHSITDRLLYGADVAVKPDAQAVAYYDNGVPYLATYPGRVVAINEVLTYGSDWDGDVPTLLHNAILYLAPGDVPWLSETTTQFNLAVGASATTNVTLDSAVPQVNQPGTYRAWLWINHNDPLQSGSYIPVQMDVSPAATMARLAGTISSDRPGGVLANAQAVVKGPAGTFTYTTGADGKFGRWFTAAQAGTYSITATAAGYVTGTTTANLTSGVTTTTPIVLKLDAPWITEAPSALSVALVEGTKLTQTVTINNFGQRDLTYQFIEFPPTATLPLAIKTIANNEPLVIEPELQAKLVADGSTGYLIYFRERPDLSAAYNLDWQARGEFVMNALKTTADRSQAATRAYLDAQGADYQSFWIDNVIVVKQSSRATFTGLTDRPEIAALRVRRTMYPIDTDEEALAAAIPTVIESNIAHVKAPEVWAMGYTGQGVVVSSIDTGVRYTHQALNAKYRGNLGGGTYEHNYNWWDPYGDHPTAPADDNGHGSHTMGIMIGDDGGANQIGMAPGAKWIAARGCNTSNCTDAALLEAAQWIAAPWNLAKANPDPSKRPNVVNNSWGDCSTTYDPWYRGVVDSWQAAGIYPVFSNGNASNCGYPEPPGLNTVGNPARYGNVTGVGATTQNTGEYATFSNWGPTDNPDTINPRGHADLKPQVLAPGTARSSVNSSDSAYGVIGGTSMSAPHVVGLIALMWSAAPCMVGDYAKTETLIEETAIPIPYDDGTGGGAHVPNYATGWGEINALAAVQAARNECLVDVPWIQEVPVTGTVASLSAQGVGVVFDSTGLTPGVYTATLQINNNDPLSGKVRIPVTMTVQAYQPTFTVVKTVSPFDMVAPGGLLTYTITILNGGRDSTAAAVTDWVPANTIYIAGSATGGLMFVDPPANPATWNNTLASGADHTFTFRVQVNPSVSLGTIISNTVTVVAYGQTYVSTAAVPVNVAPVIQYKVYLPIVRR